MTVSRAGLDSALEAYTLGESTPEQRAVIADAAQAVLDGEPLEWCVVHKSESFGPGRNCRKYSDDEAECQFESQVRVKITP